MNKDNGVAFLWDESFLWGLMAYRALTGLNLPFDLIAAKDIQNGCLNHYRMLFVPGGWASNKRKALGENGIKAIQDFVAGGGIYLGFCGGAGLATQAKGCIGLLNVNRRPTQERVPSFSGRIELKVNSHQIWARKGETDVTSDPSGVERHASHIFHAWWPSQFFLEGHDIQVLATYGRALPESFSSDLNVGDVEAHGNWKELEKKYQINLDPGRLLNEPAIVEGKYGKGRVMMSLVHFDTPGDVNGQQVLINLWEYLAGYTPGDKTGNFNNKQYAPGSDEPIHALPLLNLSAEIISLGQRNFLWFWRNSMLLQWRRGVRGLEYNTLYIMLKEISEIAEKRTSGTGSQKSGVRSQETEYIEQEIDNDLSMIEAILSPFAGKAKRLLMLERYELQKGRHITYDKCDHPEIQELRAELFSESKSHGGIFKELINEVDEVLFRLLKEQ